VQDAITFGLAFLGYLLVAANVVLHFRKRPRRELLLVMAAVILVHVGLVWSLRFGWSLTLAWNKGPAGFVIFHAALVLLCGAAVVPDPWSRRLLYTAFPIVSAGGLGATFTYDFVAGYRLPLLAALVGTLLLCWLGYRRGIP